MKKWLVIVMALLVLSFVACGAEHDLPGANLVIIVGNRANTYPLSDNDRDRAINIINESFASTGERYNVELVYWIVFSDGKPRLSEQYLNDEIRVGNPVQSGRATLIRDAAKGILEKIESLPAMYNEADLLNALHEAVNHLRGLECNRPSHILIIDSGISTSGYLDMRDVDIFEMSDEDIMLHLYERNALLDLEGIKVTFLNIGNAAYPQEAPRVVVNRLKSVWGQILYVHGVTPEPWGYLVRGREPITSERSVSVVWFEVPTPTPEPPCNLPVRLGSALLRFEPNTHTFLDERCEVIELIKTHVGDEEQIRAFLETPGNMLYVIGSESRRHPDRPNDREPRVSRARAEMVKNLLVEEFNVPSDRIAIHGAGTTVLPWRNAVEFPDGGELDEDAAWLNRVAVIVPLYIR